MDGTGVRSVIEGLQGNNTIQKLDLSENRIDTEGAQDLSQFLSTNSSLVVLALNGIVLWYRSVNYLTHAIHRVSHWRQRN
jgi:Ran GTPase-activating protein (RanGAP) involved in mRNA processing and transport